jgi:hypothetical protein
MIRASVIGGRMSSAIRMEVRWEEMKRAVLDREEV